MSKSDGTVHPREGARSRPRKIYTPEQIIRKLREADVLIADGMPAQQAARQIGVSEQTHEVDLGNSGNNERNNVGITNYLLSKAKLSCIDDHFYLLLRR